MCHIKWCDEVVTAASDGAKVWRATSAVDHSRRELEPKVRFELRGALVPPNKVGPFANEVALQAEAKRLIVVYGGTVVFYSHATLTVAQVFRHLHKHAIKVFTISPTRRSYLSASVVNIVETNNLGNYVGRLVGHSKPITALRLHPLSPSMVVSSSEDGTVRIWDLDSCAEIHRMLDQPKPVLGLDLFASHQGPKLFAWTAAHIYEYNVMHAAHTFLYMQSNVGRITHGLCPGKHMRLVCTGNNGSVSLVAPKARKLVTTMMAPPALFGAPSKFAYCAEADLLFVLLEGPEIWVYTARTAPASRLHVWSSKHVQSLVDGAVCGGKVRVDSSARVTCIASVRWEGALPEAPAPRSRRKRFAPPPPPQQQAAETATPAGSDTVGSATAAGAEGATLEAAGTSGGEAAEAAVPEDSPELILLGTSDGRVVLIDALSARLRSAFHTGSGPVTEIRHRLDQPDSIITRLTPKNEHEVLALWDLPTLRQRWQYECEPDVTSWCYSLASDMQTSAQAAPRLCSDTLVTGHENGHLSVSVLEIQKGMTDFHQQLPRDVNELAASSRDGGGPAEPPLQLWSLAKTIQTHDCHMDGPVTSVAASMRHGCIISTGWDGTMKVWDMQGSLTAELKLTEAVAAGAPGANHDVHGSAWCAQFLNDGGDVVVAFGSSLHTISRNHVLPCLAAASRSTLPPPADSSDFDAEGGSVYEDPALRYAHAKLSDKPLTVAKYLSPYEEQLSADWFLQGGAPPESAFEVPDGTPEEAGSFFTSWAYLDGADSEADTDAYLSGTEYPWGSEAESDGPRPEPFNFTPMGVNSISFGSPHVRCTPMWALSTCGEPNKIKKNTHPKNIAARSHEQATGPRLRTSHLGPSARPSNVSATSVPTVRG